jgi:hypothetical protein
MSAADGDRIQLAQRQRAVAPMMGKVLGGSAGLGVAIAGLVVLTSSDVDERLSPALQLGMSAVSVLLLLAGVLIGQDGVTDLLARRATRFPRKTIMLDPDGLHFSAEWKDAVFEVSVPWREVSGCEFRPGLGGHVFLCFDAPDRFPAPLVDPEVFETFRPVPERERAMLLDSYHFGTPFAVNLAICQGVDTATLDRQLRRWTDGRCFLPSE